jgi:perosamine synthetase
MKADSDPAAATAQADTLATRTGDTKVHYHPLDDDAALYPRPFLPMVPAARLADFVGRRTPPCPSRFLADDVILVRNGRTAIAEVLRAAGVGPDDEVIIPAYHCRTMVDPARWLGASVVFSRINPDLSLDVANAIDRMGSRTRAMIVPHYFGFPQALRPLLEACVSPSDRSH